MLKLTLREWRVTTPALLLLACGGWLTANAQNNILQPGDPIIASSANTPGSEGVANAIDGKPTKYLNFDTRTGGKPSGFVVTPSVGVTRVVGIAMESANDAIERDPKVITIEGSNDDQVTGFDAGNWELIVKLDNIPAWETVFGATDNRFKTQTFFFANFKPYKHYRWTVLETQTANGCCMQIAEVQLLGSLLPQTVVQPGDAIIASSANTPGSEGVANAIDGKPTKYLNFDTRTGGKPSGFVGTPSIGKTLITGISMESANDAVERDPKVVTIEGSNDDQVTGFDTGNWELIKKLDNIPAWDVLFGTDNRFKWQTFLFDNYKPYKHYRWTVLETQTANGCCMQIAEVQLLGTGAPKNVLQPGDVILASSANTPGSEGVANAIDGKPTKYLNFDTRTGGKPSGFAATPSIGATTIIGMALESANDAIERDPKVVTIEGSNDDALTAYDAGNWELIVKFDAIPSWDSVFGTTNRFQWQEFSFPNQKAYKHYRWTVLATQTENTCCMQIAEVELRAVTQQTDCNKAKFLVQPVDTLVLEGATATFSTTVNGPWPLQWYSNGAPIPGASAVTYTTDPVTTQNATNVYTVAITGCETSTPVKAVIFKPSTVKSVAVNFIGEGANGTPTSMLTNDIAGLQTQAYWNNAITQTGYNGDGAAFTDDVFVDSDNQTTTITVDYASSGRWGAGTGDKLPIQRMLNGLVHAQPGTPGRITFGNVPAGKHAIIAYTVGIPLQFQNADYYILNPTTGARDQVAYTRVVNADEYNAAPGFYRGSSTDPAKRTLATYVRFDNVSAAADGTVTLGWDTITTGYDRGAPVNAIQLVLNAPAPGAAPVITVDPQPTVAPADGTAIVSVTATGSDLTYQWRKNGRNLPNGGNISGATTSTLQIASFSAADEAIYSVAVFNPGGSVISGNASVRLSAYDIKDGLVGYWKFDETGGASAANAATGGKAGTVSGAAAWGKGQIGNALVLDGSSYVQVDSYTIAKKGIAGSAWVNIPAGTAANVAIFRNAERALGLGAGVGPGTPAGQFEIGLNYDDTTSLLQLSAAIGAGPNLLRVTAPTAFALGSWQHVAFSADGAQLRLFVNGAQVAVRDYSGDINKPDISYLSMGVVLNTDTNQVPSVIVPDDTAPNWMAGQLDDLALWTRGLTAEEATKIYDAGKQAQALDTVKLEPPSAVIEFTSIKRNTDGTITIEWTGGGTLQTSASVASGWQDVTGATSPYTFTPTSAQLFGRIKK